MIVAGHTIINVCKSNKRIQSMLSNNPCMCHIITQRSVKEGQFPETGDQSSLKDMKYPKNDFLLSLSKKITRQVCKSDFKCR